MDLFTVGVAAFAGLGGSLVLLFAIGAHVVRKHPGKYDPARNAKRYVAPAAALVILAALFALAIVACFALAIIQALTS